LENLEISNNNTDEELNNIRFDFENLVENLKSKKFLIKIFLFKRN